MLRKSNEKHDHVLDLQIMRGRKLLVFLFGGALVLVSILLFHLHDAGFIDGHTTDGNSIDSPDDATLPWNPRLYEKVGKKWDDLSTGKSCEWEKSNTGGKESWKCQDCGSGNKTKQQNQCKPLIPLGRCKSFQKIDWDKGRPGKRSHFRHEAADQPTGWVTTHWKHPTEYELPACSADLSLPCFDLDRCLRDGPMKVFVHNYERSLGIVQAIDRAAKLMPGEIAVTAVHDEACLFVVSEYTFNTKEEMLNNPDYMGETTERVCILLGWSCLLKLAADIVLAFFLSLMQLVRTISS